MPPVTALLSFILTVMRGYDTQSVIFGLATHTRAVVTGWWQASFRHLTADWAPFCGDISSSQLLGQQPARCRGSSSFDRLMVRVPKMRHRGFCFFSRPTGLLQRSDNVM